MGFTLDDIVIDRVQYGFAEELNGNPLYTLHSFRMQQLILVLSQLMQQITRET